MIMDTSLERARKIIKTYRDVWLGLENISSVGTGRTDDGRVCIVISMVKDDPATRDIFPGELDDIPVEFSISGKINAL